MGRYLVKHEDMDILWEIILEENFVERSNKQIDDFVKGHCSYNEDIDQAIRFWQSMGYEVYREEPIHGDTYVIFKTVSHGILGDSDEVYGIYNEEDFKEETLDYMQFHNIEIPNEEFDGLQMWRDQGFDILICKEM